MDNNVNCVVVGGGIVSDQHPEIVNEAIVPENRQNHIGDVGTRMCTGHPLQREEAVLIPVARIDVMADHSLQCVTV